MLYSMFFRGPILGSEVDEIEVSQDAPVRDEGSPSNVAKQDVGDEAAEGRTMKKKAKRRRDEGVAESSKGKRKQIGDSESAEETSKVRKDKEDDGERREKKSRKRKR